MSIQIDTLKDLETTSLNAFSIDYEKHQMRDQIAMLEAEIDRQSTIIDALIKAIKVIERG